MGQSISETIRQSERIRLDLIRTEIEMGFTFARIALKEIENKDKRDRNIRNARAAYDAILGLSAQAANNSQIADLQKGMAELKSMLTALGETDL